LPRRTRPLWASPWPSRSSETSLHPTPLQTQQPFVRPVLHRQPDAQRLRCLLVELARHVPDRQATDHRIPGHAPLRQEPDSRSASPWSADCAPRDAGHRCDDHPPGTSSRLAYRPGLILRSRAQPGGVGKSNDAHGRQPVQLLAQSDSSDPDRPQWLRTTTTLPSEATRLGRR